jgi:hypothetical protein
MQASIWFNTRPNEQDKAIRREYMSQELKALMHIGKLEKHLIRTLKDLGEARSLMNIYYKAILVLKKENDELKKKINILEDKDHAQVISSRY